MKIIAIVGTVIGLSICHCDARAEAAADRCANHGADVLCPVEIAIAQDFTISGPHNLVQPLQPAHLDPLFELLQQHGGEIGVGSVEEDSNRSLIRLRIDPAPMCPPPPPKKANPFAQAQSRAEYQEQVATREEFVRMWREATSSAISEFLAAAKPFLAQSADRRSSDVWGAVARLDLFLAEPDTEWGVTPHKYLILNSDGLHTTKRPPVALRSGARLVVVNGAGVAGSLASLDPVLFESAEAAIRWIVTTESTGR